MKQLFLTVLCIVAMLLSVMPASAQTQQELEDELLGTVSAQYESNGDPGLISGGDGDLGGASYGAYQFASAYNIPYTFAKWCVSSGTDKTIGNTLLAAYEKDGNKLGENFNIAWEQIADKDATVFLKTQRLYVKAKYYDPAVTALKQHFNLDVSSYGIAFKNAVWSRTLQHGLGSYDNENGFLGILKQVAKATAGGLASLSEESLITAIYEESGGLSDSGTNPMLTANAGGNAWIVRSYNLEGKYMKYFSGNSAAVQAGVYLRLRVKEIQKLLDMLATYGGYSGEENGKRTPYLKENQLIFTECDTLTGFYGSANLALSVSDINKKEGKGALNFLPLSSTTDISLILKCKAQVNFSSFSHLQFYLYLPEIVWDEAALLTVSGTTQEKTTVLAKKPLSTLSSGWQTVKIEIPSTTTIDSLAFTFSGCPESVVGERFLLDEISAVAPSSGFNTYKVSADALHCRTGPASDYASLGLFPENTLVTVLAKQNGWYLCSGVGSGGKVLFGWSSGGYLQQVTEAGLLGDVNGDSLINALDALHILQYAVGKREFTPEAKLLADINGDKQINASDALQVLRLAVHKG